MADKLVLVTRSDLRPGQQAVQAAHAMRQLFEFSWPKIHMDMNKWIGVRFERLMVINLGGTYKNGTRLLVCVCDCGKTVKTSLPHLKRGEVKSCGCFSRERMAAQAGKCHVDMTGQKIGRLTALRPAGQTKNKTVKWECICDCGKTKIVSGHLLRRGASTSCGCLATEVLMKRNKAGRNPDQWLVEWRFHKAHIRSAGHPSFLTQNQYQNIVILPCHYCGKEPSVEPKARQLREDGVLVSGIDRIDSSRGYEIGNCVPCCKECNFAKGVQTYANFLESTRKRFLHMSSVGLL